MRRLFALPAYFDCHFAWLVAALVAVMGLAQFTSAIRESPVWDENYDIAAAYTYLRTSDYSLNSDHPALGKLLNGLPLLALDLELPPRETVWTADKAIKAGRKFVFENRVPAEKIVICSRSVSIVFTLAVGCVLALWARRRFGSSVALLALCFYAFDPNLIANGRYVTSDPYIAGFSWLACIAWGEYLDDRTWRKLLLSGAMLGCALGSKTSALILPAILLLLHLLHGISVRPRSAFGTRLRRLVLDNAVCCAIAFVTLLVIYAPEVKAALEFWITGRKTLPFLETPLSASAVPNNPIGIALQWMGNTFHLPSFSYLMSLNIQASHMATGHLAYLLGKFAVMGWWYYFPIAALVKMPSATLLLLILGLSLAVWRGPWRRISFDFWLLAVPPFVFFATAMVFSHVNTGFRYLLPAVPFLIVLGARLLLAYGPARLRFAFVPVLAALVLLLLTESVAIYPHYLAFFNWPSGGPSKGPRYLLDTNLDWGQDLKNLADWAEQNGVVELCLCYFGNAPPEHYRLVRGPLPRTGDPREWEQVDCVVAVSATPLFGLYVPYEQFAWLRRQKPLTTIGHSIYVYDLRRKSYPRDEDPAGPGTYDDRDSRIRYFYAWSRDQQFSEPAGGTLSYSSQPGARARFVFRGTEVTWVHTKAHNRGEAIVTIDGVPRETIDLFSKDTQWQRRKTYGGLVDGVHKLVIVNRGTRNPAATDIYIDVDQFEVK